MDLIGKADTQPEQSQTEEKVWDRQRSESEKAFRAFVAYRDLQVDRTFEAVAGQLRCSGANVRRWAKKWNWV
jgi:hypothetical protein